MRACTHQHRNQAEGKHTHTELCRRPPNSSHEKEEKREGEEERFKICCQERNKLYSSTQKQEQSFIFAFWSFKCNCCSSQYKWEIKHGEGQARAGRPGSPSDVGENQGQSLVDNKEPTHISFSAVLCTCPFNPDDLGWNPYSGGSGVL